MYIIQHLSYQCRIKSLQRGGKLLFIMGFHLNAGYRIRNLNEKDFSDIIYRRLMTSLH